jgi:hypothetical protein
VRVLVAFAVLVDEVGATAVDVDGEEMVVVVVVVDFAARSVRDVEAAVEMEPRVSLPCVA